MSYCCDSCEDDGSHDSECTDSAANGRAANGRAVPIANARIGPVAGGRVDPGADDGADPGVVARAGVTQNGLVRKSLRPFGYVDLGVLATAGPVTDDRAVSVADVSADLGVIGRAASIDDGYAASVLNVRAGPVFDANADSVVIDRAASIADACVSFVTGDCATSVAEGEGTRVTKEPTAPGPPVICASVADGGCVTSVTDGRATPVVDARAVPVADDRASSSTGGLAVHNVAAHAKPVADDHSASVANDRVDPVSNGRAASVADRADPVSNGRAASVADGRAASVFVNLCVGSIADGLADPSTVGCAGFVVAVRAGSTRGGPVGKTSTPVGRLRAESAANASVNSVANVCADPVADDRAASGVDGCAVSFVAGGLAADPIASGRAAPVADGRVASVSSARVDPVADGFADPGTDGCAGFVGVVRAGSTRGGPVGEPLTPVGCLIPDGVARAGEECRLEKFEEDLLTLAWVDELVAHNEENYDQIDAAYLRGTVAGGTLDNINVAMNAVLCFLKNGFIDDPHQHTLTVLSALLGIDNEDEYDYATRIAMMNDVGERMHRQGYVWTRAEAEAHFDKNQVYRLRQVAEHLKVLWHILNAADSGEFKVRPLRCRYAYEYCSRFDGYVYDNDGRLAKQIKTVTIGQQVAVDRAASVADACVSLVTGDCVTSVAEGEGTRVAKEPTAPGPPVICRMGCGRAAFDRSIFRLSGFCCTRCVHTDATEHAENCDRANGVGTTPGPISSHAFEYTGSAADDCAASATNSRAVSADNGRVARQRRRSVVRRRATGISLLCSTFRAAKIVT